MRHLTRRRSNARWKYKPLLKHTSVHGRYVFAMLIIFAFSQKLYTSARGGTNISSSQAFQIIVLTMNRPHGLSDLLKTIQSTDYDGDRVDLVIHIDRSEELQETLKVAKKFKFSFGKKSITVSRKNKGLAQSWFDAWSPISNNVHFS